MKDFALVLHILHITNCGQSLIIYLIMCFTLFKKMQELKHEMVEKQKVYYGSFASFRFYFHVKLLEKFLLKNFLIVSNC